jgi:periplasmic protein CpxP/Spy
MTFRHIFALTFGPGSAVVNSLQNRNILSTKCSFHQTLRPKPQQGASPMNRFILSASLTLALSSTLVFAQQQPDATQNPAPAVSAHHHARNPQREAAKLSKSLNLSSDQTAKLEPILVDRDQKLAALNNDATISPVVMKQQRKAIHQQTMQQLATVLSPDQLQQMKSRHHGHGAPTQAQPQPNPQAGL